MDGFDIDALLEKNPKVDKEAVKKRLEKARGEKAARPPASVGTASPYGGRRLVVGEQAAWSEGGISRNNPRGGSAKPTKR